MDTAISIGSRTFSNKELDLIIDIVDIFPSLPRQQIASTICENLNWKNEAKNLKVHSCLALLDKLQKIGKIKLPTLRKNETKKCDHIERKLYDIANKIEIDGRVEEYKVYLKLVAGENVNQWKDLVERYHYLGHKNNFGLHLKYFIYLENIKNPIGCMSFTASSTYQLKCRDEFIGWNAEQRKSKLNWVINNNRFLIFPWIKIVNLASKVLYLVSKTLPTDWYEKFKYKPVLFETYVDPSKFNGTIYKSSNWSKIGQTSGNYKRDKNQEALPKDVYVLPIVSNYKNTLFDIKASKRSTPINNLDKCIETFLLNQEELNLWEKIQLKIAQTCKNIDENQMSKNRKVNALTMLLAIYKITFAKNFESYSTVLCELLDNANTFGIKLSFRETISASTFCDARKNFPEESLKQINKDVIALYEETEKDKDEYLWKEKRIFAVDGSKVNLPKKTMNKECGGYKLPCSHAFYPQGLISCIYRLKSKLAYDYTLVSSMNEQEEAIKHLSHLKENDVVVYDRGYLSYALLYMHNELRIDGIFRLKKKSFKVIDNFIANDDNDLIVELTPSRRSFQRIIKKYSFVNNQKKIKMRLMKYNIGSQEYYIGTTICDTQITIEDYSQAYHARWGHEELYKSFKHQIKTIDFHGKTEAFIKQEIYAGFNILTLNRIMANNVEEKFHENHSIDSFQRKRKVNFKKQLDDFYRIVEPVIAGSNEIQKEVIARNTQRSKRQSCKTRDDRQYDRKSHKHINKWQKIAKKK